jgi:hypothetical protein
LNIYDPVIIELERKENMIARLNFQKVNRP